MPETELRRYAVVLLDATRGRQWRDECDTEGEAQDILDRERHRASGYLVFDRESREIVKSRNLLAQDHGTD
ncbi:hypothetical protein [Methylomagnum ishizawai]|uniref:hypothetical protein n=1 Tax=Methylomagnum ishizawai TaxID=1760988 RepID=UPI001C32825A|nr:hypothetical protein [Methylomagnum ishizawai]BBL77485.1 hypothetical protein MishRS11D_45830 [Methylomagnum ishizawai]